MAKRDPITGKIIPDSNPIQETNNTNIVQKLREAEGIVAVVEPPKIVESPKVETVVQEVKEPEFEEDADWTALHVDSQELSVFMACEQKYDYVFNRHLVPIDGVSSGIQRGTIVHNGMFEYWKEMISTGSVEESSKKCIRRIKTEIESDLKFSQEDKIETLQNVLNFLKHIQSYSWIPLEVEKFFRIKVFEDPALRIRIYLTGRIDLIVKTPQIPVLPIDFKTESVKGFYSQLSNQFRIYSIACGTNLVGVQRIGFQATVEDKDKFKLELLPFDSDVLEEFRTISLPTWAKRMLLAHEENQYPMNTSSCISGPFRCQFSDAYNGGICNVSRSVREQKLKRYFIVGEEWDPSKIE